MNKYIHYIQMHIIQYSTEYTLSKSHCEGMEWRLYKECIVYLNGLIVRSPTQPFFPPLFAMCVHVSRADKSGDYYFAVVSPLVLFCSDNGLSHLVFKRNFTRVSLR